ncbi:MAG: hypothetical protein H6Q54_1634 [Deltaproteobacteria bacterium]|nr:hypothetical protein [Deltaproteobacteria bacterium]
MRTNTFKEQMELKFTSPFEAMPGINESRMEDGRRELEVEQRRHNDKSIQLAQRARGGGSVPLGGIEGATQAPGIG